MAKENSTDAIILISKQEARVRAAAALFVDGLTGAFEQRN
jgi:hypothetical protein